MKKIFLLVGVLMLLLVTASYSKAKPQKDIRVLSVKKQTLYFKVSKSFIGGTVEVHDANDNCLESDEVPHTHTMIYFDEMPKGRYIIRVRKGDLCTEFTYDNI